MHVRRRDGLLGRLIEVRTPEKVHLPSIGDPEVVRRPSLGQAPGPGGVGAGGVGGRLGVGEDQSGRQGECSEQSFHRRMWFASNGRTRGAQVGGRGRIV